MQLPTVSIVLLALFGMVSAAALNSTLVERQGCCAPCDDSCGSTCRRLIDDYMDINAFYRAIQTVLLKAEPRATVAGLGLVS